MTRQRNLPTEVMPPEPKKRRWLWRLVQLVLGLVVGVAIAEAIFWWRDDGAFPHVNFYVPDERLGVRLEPGATERLKFRDNPTTEIRVNAQGYRGAAWPAAGEGEVLVVGDSQVFGLGVDEGETFSAQLARATKRTVINAGVPTYGPLEYNAVVRQVLESRRPEYVVYTVNLANDLFEHDRPNAERHAVWDGWAVRAETAPASYREFPGRELLYRRSHAFYALRRWLHQIGDEDVDRAFASEGTWRDLVRGGTEAGGEHEHAQARLEKRARDRRARLAKLGAALAEAEDRGDELMFRDLGELEGGYGDAALRFRAARGNPGDIVRDEAVEEGREIALTAQVIRRGVMMRDRIERQLRARRDASAQAMIETIDEREQLQARRAAVQNEPLGNTFVPSVLEPRLREVQEICAARGAKLVVLVLPLDVQVSSDEWRKYGVDPIDMEPTRVLIEDVVRTAERMGVRALDATEALRGAEPGAFLDGDIHLTPKGHRAVAEALAAKLAEPAPVRAPDEGLPPGRSRVPDSEEWLRTPEAIVRGSSRARCETIRVREWLRVSCLRNGPNVPSAIEVVQGGHGEALRVVTEEAATLIVPIFEGEDLLADFFWTAKKQRLVVRWPRGSGPQMSFEDPVAEGRPREVSDAAARLCACHIEVSGEKQCTVEQGWPTGECTPTCVNAFGEPSAQCLAAHRDDCPALLRCARGDPLSLPPCPAGFANAGGTGQCFRLCSDERPCERGTCEPWMGSAICR